MDKPVVVIGAGIGGLSAAIRLAIAGRRVIVLEKNARVGGKMGEFQADGFRWDTGPSVITMRHVFEDLFAAAGRQFEDYVELMPIEPLTRYFYQDGTVLDASANISKMAQEIEQMVSRDVEGYLAYLAYAARIHRITGPVFIYDQPPKISSFARVPVQDWLKVDPFRTMNGAIRRFVRDNRLRQLLGRFATYVGGSPYDAPATLNVIAHVELTGGVWYPKGGVYRIAHAMAELALELGVEICTETAIERICVDDRQAISGVQVDNGRIIEADTVVANVDVTTVYSHLLPEMPSIQRRAKTLASYEPSCSGLIFMWGVAAEHPQLVHHNIFFSSDYEHEFQQIFKHQVPPDEPTIYAAITSKADPEHAPGGHENWFVLLNMPPTNESIDWSQEVPRYRRVVLDRLNQMGISIEDKIVSENAMTPNDLGEATGAWRGALYGPSANSKWTAFRRPNNRSKEVKGLYFAGGTTHPGGGVPMVTLSGKVAAEMILEDTAKSR